MTRARSHPLVLVDAAIPDEPLAALSVVAEVERYADDEDLDRRIEERGARVVGLGVQLTTRIGEPLLSRLPALRVVANYAVGTDNVDLEAAARRQIVVTNTPDVLTEATADLAWALVLAVARRLREGDALVRSGIWRGWHPRELLGKELHGATLAILGPGRIGSAVARRGSASGMRIAYWGRGRRPALEREFGARAVGLDEALAVGDVVSIHLPLTDETHHLLDAARIARMKPDAILVNTARGPIVDERALADALARGHLMGAGLDVYENEPLVHPALRASKRTVLLPHLGSATVATRGAMAARVAANLAAVLRGEPAPDRVGGVAGPTP